MFKPQRAIHAAFAILVVSALQAQVVRQVTDARTSLTWMGDMDEAGTTVYAVSASDPYGTNARHVHQIFRWDRATGSGAQLTSFHDGVLPGNVSVSDDGGIVVFVSDGDPKGENPDRSQELFRIDGDGNGLVQLTHAAAGTGEIFSYRVAGGGGVVALAASFDYLGTNPDHDGRVFVMSSDGAGLRQLDTGAGAYAVSVSDDGERLVFERWPAVHGIGSDGSGLHLVAQSAHDARLSGDGSTVVLTTRFPPPGGNPSWCNGGEVVVAVDFEGTGATRLSGPCNPTGDSRQPDVSDDGQSVVYVTEQWLSFSPYGDVWTIRRDGSGETRLTFLWPAGQQCFSPRVSGGGSALTFLCAGVDLVAGSNTDLSSELYASSGSGTARRQLSSGFYGNALDADLSSDGSRIVFASSFNFLGDAPGAGQQIYRVQSDGSSLTRLSNLRADFTAKEVAVSDDGSAVVFVVGYLEPFNDQVYIRRTEGVEPARRLVGTGGFPQNSPDITADGSLIVFESMGTLYRVHADGTGLQALASGWSPRIDAAGVFIAFASQGGVFRIRSDGTDLRQIASSGSAWSPDISADGDLVAYRSDGDPLGTNPDHRYQIFLYRASTAQTFQLTEKGSNASPSISRDGGWVYYFSYESGSTSLLRVHVKEGVIEHAGPPDSCQVRSARTGGDGSRTVFLAAGDCAGRNADGNVEVYFIDHGRLPGSVSSIEARHLGPDDCLAPGE